jgi:hypothetical protein
VARHPRQVWRWPVVAGVIGLAAAVSVAVLVVPRSPVVPRSDDATGTGPAPSASAPVTETPTAGPTPSTGPTAAARPAPARFTTRAPGTSLPTGEQCATWVRAQPYRENKGANRSANNTKGHRIGSTFFSGGDARANRLIAPRVDGGFTGTTGQILRWAACKWGIDEELVFAQAAIESWWRQDTLGDWTTDASRCAPGRGLGADGKAGQCPESFGILQNRYPYEQTAWPGIATSTAMNADLSYAIWRSCFEGYETWLNTVERGQQYAAGDAWGCFGRWFSGRWHTSAGDGYVQRVRDYLNQKIWTTPNFQQP